MFDKTLLLDYWNPTVERCGIVTADGEIIELQNTHPDPTAGFRMGHPENAVTVATWHTHPDGSANLSVLDYRLFLRYTKMNHFVVGRGTLAQFYVHDGRVFIYEEDDYLRRASCPDVSRGDQPRS